MAEDCKICFKEETIKRIADETLENKLNIKEITKIVSDIKEVHLETKFALRDIKKNQEDTTIADKERKVLIDTKDRENKAFMAEKFKDLEDKRLADILKRETKEAAAIKAKEEATAAAIKAKEEATAEIIKEKRATRRSIWVAIIVLAMNTIVGILVKNPQWFK